MRAHGDRAGARSRRQGLEIRRRVGYVPDQPALYDWMTVEEAGWFVAGFYPLGFQKHYNELVEHFELPLDRKIKDSLPRACGPRSPFRWRWDTSRSC